MDKSDRLVPPVLPIPKGGFRNIRKETDSWDGTIYVSNLPKDGDRSSGEYVEDIFHCYCYVKKFRTHLNKKGEWDGSVLLILDDLEVKDKLIKEGMYLYEHKDYRNVKVEHHKPILWYK